MGILRKDLDTVLCFPHFFFLRAFVQPQWGEKMLYNQKSFPHIHKLFSTQIYKGDIQPQVLKTFLTVISQAQNLTDSCLRNKENPLCVLSELAPRLVSERHD